MPDPFNVNLINAVGSGGGGGGNEVELTWAEYEALSEAEKMNGNNYFITDINTTKSLTSKVLCDISVTSTGSNTLNDSIYNYDFIVAELYAPNETYIEDIFSKAMVTPNNAGRFRLNRLWNTNFYGVVELGLSGTTCNIIDISQTGTFITGTCHLRITGYIYQRVVVPNQMINYSTIETKIGTWIDGKPLYQKTVEFQNQITVSTSWQATGITISNIQMIVNACGYDMHGDNEWIDLDSLDKLYEIYSKFINR